MAQQGGVYLVCPDVRRATGGIKTIYRQADVLLRHGLRAAVVHGERGFRCSFFENQTPVVHAGDLELGPDDVLVLPEVFTVAFQPPDHLGELRRYARVKIQTALGQTAYPIAIRAIRRLVGQAGRVVILSLGAYNTFRGCTPRATWPVNPYRHPRVAATLTVSEDSQRYLRFAFPGHRVELFKKAIDPARFMLDVPKRPQVCFMPRRRAEDVIQVLGMLRLRGALAGFETRPIDGMSEAEVARTMAESAVFLSFSDQEGLPRPPMEAMLSRCVVIGYHGRGGREFFLPEHCFPVETGDIVGFVEAAEQVLGRLREDPRAYDARTEQARAFIRERYSSEREEREVVGFYRSVLES